MKIKPPFGLVIDRTMQKKGARHNALKVIGIVAKYRIFHYWITGRTGLDDRRYRLYYRRVI